MPNDNTPILTDEQQRAIREAEAHASSIASSYKQAIELQGKMNKNLKGYIEGLKRIKDIEEDIVDYIKVQEKLDAKIAISHGEEKEALLKEKKVLEGIIKSLGIQQDILKDNLKTISKTNIVAKEMTLSLLKGFAKLPDLIQKGYGQIKNSGLFEMDKAIKTSALSMGLLGKGSDAFRGSMKAASMNAAMLGTKFEDLVKIQAEYADELGRNVMLGQSGAEAINEMAKGTNMGLEGATKMAAEFENVGMSAENTRDFVEQTMNDASKMGLNASKVIKNIQHNIKMLNKYNFKGGAKGLEQMALSVSKLGVDMDTIAPMADKLWNVEGAVEMSAQLQVMGGDFAALADPFKLMYKARNDMQGLTEDFANAAKSSMMFGKNGIEMNTLEMSRLKKIAEETGIEYDKLVTMGRNAFKNDAIKKQASGLDEKQMEFISNMAKFSENGTATIELTTGPKLVSQLNAADKMLIDSQIKEKATLKARADAAMTFDEKLQGLINGIKVDLLPIVEEMSKTLVPALKSFIDRFQKEKWGESISKLASMVGTFVSTIGKFIIDNPIASALTYGAAKFTGFIFDKLEWIANGLMLAKGFNMGASVGAGGSGNWLTKLFGVKSVSGVGSTVAAEGAAAEGAAGAELATAASTGSKVVANSAKLIGRLGGVVAGLTSAVSEFYSNKDNKSMSTGENLGRSAIKGAGAGLGAWGGAAAGAAIGEAIFPLGGGIPGALIGGALGAFGGNSGGDLVNQGLFGPKVSGINDGVIQFNPNDKFMKVNDSTMVAGTNVNGNKDLANALNGGGIKSPSQSSAISNNLNVNLSELKISGTIELKLGNNVSKEIGDSLIQDPVFVRNISKMINIEMGKIKNIKIS